MKEFAYIWAGEPIDFWENAIVTSIEEYDRVMAQMPEEARAEVKVTGKLAECVSKISSRYETYFRTSRKS